VGNYEKVITLRFPKKGGETEQKKPPQAVKYSKPLARRQTDPLITFYDLAQVNHQDLNAEPVWEDHPILKTPSYTHAGTSGGIVPVFTSVRVTVEAFTNSDYQAFTDMMFNYPVTEWNRRYKKIEESTGLDTDFTTDLRVSMQDAGADPNESLFLPENQISKSGHGGSYETVKEANLAAYHWTWDRDKHGAIKENLDELTVNLEPWHPLDITSTYAGYLSLSTAHKDVYKVTSTYDAGAADVGTLTPKGKIEVYMMPQMGLWAATSQTDLFANSASAFDYKTTQILGPVYQIHPRENWPRYNEDPDTTGTGGDFGSDTKVSAYLTYQKARSGMQAATWTWNAASQFDLTYTFDNTLTPAAWSTLDQFGCSMASGFEVSSLNFFNSSARGGNTASNFPTFSTFFKAPDDLFWGGLMFRGDEPFLVAVFKMGGAFYYVWDIYAAANDFNISSFETHNQGSRFRLCRNIAWRTSFMGGLPIQPKDGTGPFYFD
jgi:hypothetical protein